MFSNRCLAKYTIRQTGYAWQMLNHIPMLCGKNQKPCSSFPLYIFLLPSLVEIICCEICCRHFFNKLFFFRGYVAFNSDAIALCNLTLYFENIFCLFISFSNESPHKCFSFFAAINCTRRRNVFPYFCPLPSTI